MSTTPETKPDVPTSADGLVESPQEQQNHSTDAELGQKERQDAVEDFGPAPDGGLRAWLAAAAGFCIFFCGLGYSNSFGVFQQYYMAHQLPHKSADDIAWIGSVAAFLQFALGTIGGPIFDRFGVWVIRPGCVILIFTVMMISLCNQYWQFMLSQGILMGITMGIITIPSMAPLSQYFDKKRAAAFGIAISGSSIGGIVLPITFSKLLNNSTVGFGWSVRIVGFIMLPLLLFACLVISARLPPRTSNFFILRAFKEPMFLVIIAAMFFQFMGLFMPLFFLPSYAVTKGMDATLASYLLAILNAASTFGRIIPGVVADKFGRLNMFAAGGLATGIVILCMTKVESNAGLVVYAVVIGFTSGTIISGGSTAISLCAKDPREMGTYLGQGMGIGAFAVLIGPPVNGVLVKQYGGFLEASIFSGTMILVGGFIAIGSKLTTKQGIWGRV